ncbi:MAG: hypothetical protein JXR88_03650 [Clostridia bacterium]|nr:hypothetical protein [Clostridia bacterium]
MNSLLYGMVGRIVPLMAADLVATFETRVHDLIMVLGTLMVAAVVLPHLGKNKKIKALGFLVFGAIILAIIGDVSFLVDGVKSIFTYFTGKAW